MTLYLEVVQAESPKDNMPSRVIQLGSFLIHSTLERDSLFYSMSAVETLDQLAGLMLARREPVCIFEGRFTSNQKASRLIPQELQILAGGKGPVEVHWNCLDTNRWTTLMADKVKSITLFALESRLANGELFDYANAADFDRMLKRQRFTASAQKSDLA